MWTYIQPHHTHVASVSSGSWRGLPVSDSDAGLAEIFSNSGDHFDPAKSAIARIPMRGECIQHVQRLCKMAQDGQVWSNERETEALGAVPV